MSTTDAAERLHRWIHEHADYPSDGPTPMDDLFAALAAAKEQGAADAEGALALCVEELYDERRATVEPLVKAWRNWDGDAEGGKGWNELVKAFGEAIAILDEEAKR